MAEKALQAESEAVVDISEAELLRVLEEAQEKASYGEGRPKGAMTREELEIALEMSEGMVLRLLKLLKSQNQIEAVKVRAIDIADRRSWKPAYRLVKQGEEINEIAR